MAFNHRRLNINLIFIDIFINNFKSSLLVKMCIYLVFCDKLWVDCQNNFSCIYVDPKYIFDAILFRIF